MFKTKKKNHLKTKLSTQKHYCALQSVDRSRISTYIYILCGNENVAPQNDKQYQIKQIFKCVLITQKAQTRTISNLRCRLQCWQRNYIHGSFWQEHQHNSSLACILWYFHLIDRCVIARDALGRPPTAVAFPVTVVGLRLSTWIVWPTWRTWWIREVDMVNQWSWLGGALLWARLCITAEAGLQAMSSAYQPADASEGFCICAYLCFRHFKSFPISVLKHQKQMLGK